MNTNNETIDISKIPIELKEILFGIGKEYLSEKKKEEMIKSLDQKTMITLFRVSVVHTGFDRNDFIELKLTNEFKAVKRNLKASRKKKKVSQWLLNKQTEKRNKLKNIYSIKRIRSQYEILGKSWENYKYLSKIDKIKAEKIFKVAYNKANKQLREKYDAIENDIRTILDGISRIILTEDLLNVENSDKDFLDYLAFYILKPEHQLLSFFIVHPSWQNFPLKWYIYHQPINEGKYLLKIFSKGEDLSDFLVTKYESNDFASIHNFINDPFLAFTMELKKDTILEILKIYKTNFFRCIFITLFPLIESLIWDLTLIVHKNITPLYPNNSFKMLKSKNGTLIEKSIGNLLKNTEFDQLIDDKFIEYFCDEFYLERNPYLHGQLPLNISKKDVIRKIATLDYVLQLSKNIIKEELFKKFDKLNVYKKKAKPSSQPVM